MPMKDSYGGVQNVWYVSRPSFRCLSGAMLAFLGLLLIRTAFKEVGRQGVISVLAFLSSSDFLVFEKRYLNADITALFSISCFCFSVDTSHRFFPGCNSVSAGLSFSCFTAAHQNLLKLFRFVIGGSIFAHFLIFRTCRTNLPILPNSPTGLFLP